MAARLGGFAQCAGGLTRAGARQSVRIEIVSFPRPVPSLSGKPVSAARLQQICASAVINYA